MDELARLRAEIAALAAECAKLRGACRAFVVALTPWAGHCSVPLADLDAADRLARAALSSPSPAVAKWEAAMACALADVAADDAWQSWATYARSTTPTLMWAQPEGKQLFEAHGAAFNAKARALAAFRAACNEEKENAHE